jgi:hypothetical protein
VASTARRRHLPLQVAAAISPLIVAASGASAADSPVSGARAADSSSWYASVGAMYTDNIGASATEERSVLAPQAGLGLTYISSRDWLKSDVAAAMNYTAYPTGLYIAGQATPNPWFGAANLALTGIIVPDRFTWNVTDSYGLTPVNLARSDSPYNRQSTNIVQTGPSVQIPLGVRNELQFSGSWFHSSFGDTSQADGTGEQANASIVHRTSPNTSVSLGVSGSRIEYPASQSIDDFNIRSAYLGWNRVQGRGEIQLQLGESELRRRGLEQKSPVARVTFKRRTSATGKLSLSVGREFSSSGLAFQQNQTFFGVNRGLTNLQTTTAPFRSDFGLLSWEVGLRWPISFQASYIRQAYVSDPLLNVRLFAVNAAIGRVLTPRLLIRVRAEYDNKQFDVQGIRTDDRRVGADIVFNLGPTLLLTFSADHYNGTNGGVTNLNGQNITNLYGQNIEQVRLTYRPVPR